MDTPEAGGGRAPDEEDEEEALFTFSCNLRMLATVLAIISWAAPALAWGSGLPGLLARIRASSELGEDPDML